VKGPATAMADSDVALITFVQFLFTPGAIGA
jgi:hypothetical protein